MRVVQLISNTDRRGAQTFALALDELWAQRGIDVTTRALVPGRQDNGLAIEPLTGRQHWIAALPGVRALCRDAEVVLAHGSTTLPVAAVASGSAPFVYRSIGDLPAWAVTRRQRRTAAFGLQRAAGVSVLWDAVGAALVADFGVAANRVAVIPNAADHTRFSPPTPAERDRARAELGAAPTSDVLVVLGALAEEKQVGDVIDAVADRPSTIVLIAGDGPQRKQLQDHADRLRRPDGADIRFVGVIADPVPLLAAADLMVLASRTEGQPGVLIEAAMMGVPAAASDVGGVSSVVVHGTSGMLFPSGDIAALRSAVDHVARDRGVMGAAAREHGLAHFTLASVSDQFLALLERVARTGR